VDDDAELGEEPTQGFSAVDPSEAEDRGFTVRVGEGTSATEKFLFKDVYVVVSNAVPSQRFRWNHFVPNLYEFMNLRTIVNERREVIIHLLFFCSVLFYIILDNLVNRYRILENISHIFQNLENISCIS